MVEFIHSYLLTKASVSHRDNGSRYVNSHLEYTYDTPSLGQPQWEGRTLPSSALGALAISMSS
jgi:hypothetical protein